MRIIAAEASDARTFVSQMMSFMMKLKAPEGVGDPCVAGVILTSRDGCYEVEPEVGALLIECFGFVALGPDEKPKAAPARPPLRDPASLPKLSLPAWRTRPAAKKP